jgi:predicted DNA-binding antitoxin AbrB/MazE fold protein
VIHIRIKAVYKNVVLKPLEKLDLQENEQVEIEIRQRHADVKSLRGTLKVDPKLVDEIVADESWVLL